MDNLIWVVGSNGMLGYDVYRYLLSKGYKIVCSNSDIDITILDKILCFANSNNPKFIINCSGYTNVDKAEEEPQIAYKINSDGVKNLAIVASKLDAILIHFSTDYVFDGLGTKPWNEKDIPNPINTYGKSKLEGEKLLSIYHNKYFIFRISWLYGQHRNNFVKTILKHLLLNKSELKIVNDQIGSPTYSKELAINIVSLVEYLYNNPNKTELENKFGIYHYSDDGYTSWYEFALKIKELALLKGIIKSNSTKILPITSQELCRPAKRPINSRFDKTKVVKELNFKIKNWIENLEDLLSNKDFINSLI